MDPEIEVQTLFNDYWEWRLKGSPEFATLAGRKDYDDNLENFTMDRFEEDFTTCKTFLNRVSKIKQDRLSDETLLNLKMFKYELQTFVDGYRFCAFYNPINNIEGIQIDFARLAEWMSLVTVKDYENLIKRYKKFPVLAEQITNMLRLSVKHKMTNHHQTMFAVMEQFSEFQGDPRQTVLWDPFKDLPTNFGPQVSSRIQEEAENAIRNQVQPAMAMVAKCLEQEYLPHSRPEIGVSSLPFGIEFYNQCLMFHTSSEKYTAKLIHEIGLAEVERIEKNMKEVFSEVGFEGSVKEFVDSLRKDPRFTFTSSTEMLDYFSKLVHDVIQPKLKDFFFEEPAPKILVSQTPAAQSNAPAYYVAGTSDGSRPGKVFINCSRPDTRIKCQMVSLALHEANPGHHLHASYLLALDGLPDFRKFLEDRNYFQAPSRFPINTAFSEGWALYCEKLGFEMGLYDDPYNRFGHYSEEMFRACRLVVDTGIHAFGWSVDKAIQYMLDHTATPQQKIEIEINRYIGWPGQAVGYKIGEIFLTEQRKKCEEALGSKFDVRHFHEVVLRATGPLDLVEQEVDSYIAATK